MFKLFITLSILLTLSVSANPGSGCALKNHSLHVTAKKQTAVVICTSKNAYAYHKKDCGALKRCKAGTEELTREQAVQRGYSACKVCRP